MEQKNIKSLTKRQLLTLPGFSNLRNKTLKEIKQQLNVKLTELNLTRRGIKVRDYITAYSEKQTRDDNELFNKLSANKKQRQQTKTQRKQYKQSLKQNALEERNILNINAQYQSTKSAERKSSIC